MINPEKYFKTLIISMTIALLSSLTAIAGIDPSVLTFFGDTGAEQGRRMVRDSQGFYHGVVAIPASSTVEFCSSMDTYGDNWFLPVPGPWQNCMHPSLAIDQSDMLHLVWSDLSDIYYSNSPAGLNMWSAPVNVSNSADMSIFPSIDCDYTGAIHVAWQEVGAYEEIFYSVSTDGGISFDTPINITLNSDTSERPCVACPYDWSPGSVHISWDECGSSGFRVYHTSSPNNGGTWTTKALVSQLSLGDPIQGLFSCMAVDDHDNPHITFSQGNNIGNVFYNTSTNGGLTFGNSEFIAASVDDFFPGATIAIDAVAPHPPYDEGQAPAAPVLRVLWHDGPNAARTLYYAYKEPGWGAWTVPTSVNTFDFHNANYVYKNQHNRGGYAVCTDGPYGATVVQAAACPPLIIMLYDTPSTARPGTTISWKAYVENHTSLNQTFDLWIEARRPNGAIVVKPCGTFTVPPFFKGSGTMKLKLPGTLAPGAYTISVVIGKKGSEDWDRDTFILTVI